MSAASIRWIAAQWSANACLERGSVGSEKHPVDRLELQARVVDVLEFHQAVAGRMARPTARLERICGCHPRCSSRWRSCGFRPPSRTAGDSPGRARPATGEGPGRRLPNRQRNRRPSRSRGRRRASDRSRRAGSAARSQRSVARSGDVLASAISTMMWGSSSSASRRIATRGGNRSRIVPSVARIRVRASDSQEYCSRSRASIRPQRTTPCRVSRRTSTMVRGCSRNSPPFR